MFSSVCRLALGLLTASLSACAGQPPSTRPPNVILVVTDDQGWSQVGTHGNSVLKTPHLDRLALESAEFTRFYVSPVCSPTRASLMTGRYNYRTGVVDTYLGRSMMYADEVTVAEVLRAAQYRTGIFGKWHLGDHYPMRPSDQGFEESLVHKGGGIGQPSDPSGTSYFDPILQHNDRSQRFPGYCTDIFFQTAIKFIEKHRDHPFFVYLATNAPHAPYDVPESYIKPYRDQGLDEKDARIYGMIANIDENIGRLMAALDGWKLAEDTLLIFMSDNGPTTQHFTAGLRSQKTSVYEGGIRVPFFLRWPRKVKPSQIDRIAAHIDMAPTILEAAAVQKPKAVVFDGSSLVPILTGNSKNWPDRTLYLQSHRGNEPQLYRNFAAVTQRFKLVQPESFGNSLPTDPVFELYDVAEDPGEQANLATVFPHVVRSMKQGYEEWFRDVSSSRGYEPPRIPLGAAQENPVILTRQDWRVTRAPGSGWSDDDLGVWLVEVANSGSYEIGCRFAPQAQECRVELRVAELVLRQPLPQNSDSANFSDVRLPQGTTQLEVRILRNGNPTGPRYVEISGPNR
ncbi:MAG: arylsulfatase [Acidobacteriota bacterium]